MNIDKNKQEMQEKAFTEIFNIAEKAGIDIISVRDEDILYALEGQDIYNKLTPEICDNIRASIVEYISEDYSKYIAEAVAGQFSDEDFPVTEEELNSSEEETSD